MTAVSPRASKEEFMRALGLDAANTHHESYYRAMRVRFRDRPNIFKFADTD